MNITEAAARECPAERDRTAIRERHSAYLADESRLAGGVPEVLYFPRSTEEAAGAVAEAAAEGRTLVLSGARTGIAGGAVPQDGGGLLSLERIDHRPGLRYDEALGGWTVRVGAGTSMARLQEALRRGEVDADPVPPNALLYPVDPTETSASLGGTVATNASGARTLFYGPTRDWVAGLTVVLADGRTLRLRRGQDTASATGFRIGGQDVPVTEVAMPATKHTGGYFMRPGMDLVDLFVGGEGTLAAVTEVELRLCPRPAQTLGLCVFLPADTAAELVRDIGAAGLRPTALEYMDERSLHLLRDYRAESGESSGVPRLSEGIRAALYVEAALAGDEEGDGYAADMEAILARHDVAMDDVWAAFGDGELQAMKAFRHALPERINSIIGNRKRTMPELTKVGTDMAVPLTALGEMMGLYRDGLEAAGVEYAVFGHIGNGHLHVNILPRSREELRSAWELYTEFARQAVRLCGSVSAEHGIGRLKRKFMEIQYRPQELAVMRRVKDALDPEGLLNPGVML